MKSTLLNIYYKIDRPVYVVSYPKAGRTWLRLMVAHTLFPNENEDRKVEISKLTLLKKEVKPIIFTHYGSSIKEVIQERFYKEEIILLIRDPRDIVISSYFEQTKRSGSYSKETSISDFIRDENFGIKSIIDFQNQYVKSYKNNISLLIKYEDLHTSALDQLKLFFQVVLRNKKYVDKDKMQEAVEYSNFKKLQSRSLNSLNKRLSPTDLSDPESQKFRKGKIGGYVDYCTPEDINYMDQQMKQSNKEFGYPITT